MNGIAMLISKKAGVVALACGVWVAGCSPLPTVVRAGARFAAVEPLLGTNPDVQLQQLSGEWEFTISYVPGTSNDDPVGEVWRRVYAHMWCTPAPETPTMPIMQPMWSTLYDRIKEVDPNGTKLYDFCAKFKEPPRFAHSVNRNPQRQAREPDWGPVGAKLDDYVRDTVGLGRMQMLIVKENDLIRVLASGDYCDYESPDIAKRHRSDIKSLLRDPHDNALLDAAVAFQRRVRGSTSGAKPVGPTYEIHIASLASSDQSAATQEQLRIAAVAVVAKNDKSKTAGGTNNKKDVVEIITNKAKIDLEDEYVNILTADPRPASFNLSTFAFARWISVPLIQTINGRSHHRFRMSLFPAIDASDPENPRTAWVGQVADAYSDTIVGYFSAVRAGTIRR